MSEQAPSQRARELVRGGYDMHVHIAPDVVARKISDVGLAHRCLEFGLAGFQLKSHYTSTAERARTVREAVPGEGARTVWFPTVNSVNEQREVHPAPPGAKVPVWVRFELELRDAGHRVDPVPVVDAEGALLPAAHEVLGVIARHDMVLATGHLARDEIFALVGGAVAAGVRRIVVTHPEFPSQQISIADQVELAARGALLERCFTTPHTGKVSWEAICRASREVGPAHTVWSSDLGQTFNPAVEDGLALMADQFLAVGFSDEEVVTMAVTNTRWLAGEELP